MNDVLGQNVEIVDNIDSTAKEETKGRKLKLHDVTYEKLTGVRKILAQMGIKGEINDEVKDYSIDNDQEHLDRISILMSQYKFLDDGIEESPELIARRAIRLNEQMIYDAKLNSRIVKAMLEREKADNISAIDENAEEQLVDAINQISESAPVVNEGEIDQSNLIQKIDDKIDELKAVDGAPVIETNDDVSIPASDEFGGDSQAEEPIVEQGDNIDVAINNQDFAPLFNESPLDVTQDGVVKDEGEPTVTDSEVVDNSIVNGIPPMTDEEIEESRELLRRTAQRDDTPSFSFEDIFGPNNDIVPVDNSAKDKEEEATPVANSDEELFLEVNSLLQEADELRSRGSKAEEERDKAIQRRKAAEDRRQQAAEDEAMKKAALAEAIKKHKAYVALLKENENKILKDIEDAKAAAEEAESATRAFEEKNAYTDDVIRSLETSMENKPGRKL